MRRKMDREHALMAYVLNGHFRYSQSAIAQLMSVSQSTICNAIQQVEYWRIEYNLQKELEYTRSQLLALGFHEQIPPLLEI